MAREWDETTLGAETELLTGFPFRSERYTDAHDSIRLVRGDNIVQGALRWVGVKKWPGSESAEHEMYQLREGDVVLAMDRPWIEAGLKYAAISEHDLPCLLVQRTARLRGGPNLETRFLRYLIGSPEFTQHVHAITTGTAVPHISGSQIKNFTFLRPPLDEQRAIAHILGTLDDKIELNRRMSETLEAMARALFKSWFVDFDPVRAKAEGRDHGLPQPFAGLFPDSFEDSELGEIPRGWKVLSAGELFEVAIGKTPPRKEPQWFSMDPSEVPWMSIKDLGLCDVYISQASEYLTREAVDRFRVRRIPDSSVVLSFKLTVGRVAITDGDMVSNEAIAHFLPRANLAVGSQYLYCYLRQFVYESLGSTSSIATAVNSDSVRSIPVLVPPLATHEAFEREASPLFFRLRSLQRESRILAALRNTLLPELISGVVRLEGLSDLSAPRVLGGRSGRGDG